MTATGRTTETTPAALESAGFVKLLVRPDGDALAAAGVLARALDARGTPFQVSVGERPERIDRTATADSDAVTVAIGPLDGETDEREPGNEAILTLDPTAEAMTLQAIGIVAELGAEPDPILALAGTVAAGRSTSADAVTDLRETAREADRLEDRPGVATPVADPVDGLAHSTLVRAAWSGDPTAVEAAVGDTADGRQLASLVAIDAVGADDATERAAATIDRIVNPDATPGGPFATIGGTADVLSATARTAPGVGVALAIGHDVTETALEAWRTHGLAVHDALDAVSTARHDGVYVLRLDPETPELARTDAIESVAALAATTSTPEPVVAAVSDERIGVATTDPESAAPLCAAIADEHDLAFDAGSHTGTLESDSTLDTDAIVETAGGYR